MASFSQPLFASGFAVGATRYLDRYLGQDDTRIVLIASLAGRVTIEAIVDTGAPWCVLDPGLVDLIADLIVDEVPVAALAIRGVVYTGRLVRVRLGIQVDIGESREIEVTAFVPTLEPDEQWPLPNFLGLSGFLERIRFAVDPAESTFYFGPI
jgi:hypothetical protein